MLLRRALQCGGATRTSAALCVRRGASTSPAATRWEGHPELMERQESSADEKLPPAVEFLLMVEALSTFQQATGHFMVPFHFPIPHRADRGTNASSSSRIMARVLGGRVDLNWPDPLRGVNLGRVVHKFMTNKRHHARYPLVVDKLRGIGFPVDVDWRAYQWEMLVVAPLKAYYSLEGHTLVPSDFIVPHGDPHWPRHTWGIRLGARVHRLRQERNSLDAKEMDDLLQLEFSFDVAETTWSDKVLPALETFVALHGHCNVKRTFVVPSEAPWPKKAWGLSLGSIVGAIRHKDGYAKQVSRDAERLESLQFVWDHREASWSETVLPSMETHFQVYGHMRVPREFVVPSEAPWPPKTWGYALGVAVNHMRCRGVYAKELKANKDRIDAIQFIWRLRDYRWHECILPALEVFSDTHDHCRVPRDFVVPAEHPWPEEAWGLKLGSNVSEIRYNGAYSKYVLEDASILRAIGFLDTMPSLPVRTTDYWERPK